VSDYQAEMEKLRVIYDPVLGSGVVDAMERLQLFNVFTSPWFSAGLVVLVISIIVCTLDRTPRLWRQSADVRVVQPDPFYDPELPDRARIPGAPDEAVIAGILRRRGFRVRREAVGGAIHLYGDRHQWTKLATLITHLGLILFLVAAAVTSRFGDEQGLVVAEGDSLTVGSIGTPGLLLVRNFGFEAPGFETGAPTDFTTDLAVYRDGQVLARKVIRVNDPLEVGGYSFHQNGFGPAPDLRITDRTGGVLWSGPVALTDQHEGYPFGLLSVPGRDVGLQLLLDRGADGGAVLLVLPYRVLATDADGTPAVTMLDPMAIGTGEVQTVAGIDFGIAFQSMADFTVLIARRDPGQGIVWLAFAALITGITITFHLPRRRVWARLRGDGDLSLVARWDRHLDVQREFGGLLDAIVLARPGAAEPPGGNAAEPPGGNAPRVKPTTGANEPRAKPTTGANEPP
jgi:cytochrome c biogenesis protein